MYILKLTTYFILYSLCNILSIILSPVLYSIASLVLCIGQDGMASIDELQLNFAIYLCLSDFDFYYFIYRQLRFVFSSVYFVICEL